MLLTALAAPLAQVLRAQNSGIPAGKMVLSIHQNTSRGAGFRGSLEGWAKAGIKYVELADTALDEWLKKRGSTFRVPVLGSVFRTLGGFPVERDGNDRQPLRDSLAILESGQPLVVYPEGTRHHGRTIEPLQPGTAWLAIKAQVPIVPVGIAGTEEAFRGHGGKLPRFERGAMVVGDPIVPPPLTGTVAKRADVDALSEELRKSLQELFDRAYELRD